MFIDLLKMLHVSRLLSIALHTSSDDFSHPTFISSVHRVYIWLPRQNFQIGGHVSLLLNDGTYISWWPEHGKDFKKAKVFTLHGIAASNGTSLEEDIRSMEYSYNHEFEIPSERLDLQRMKDFWESVLTTRNFDPKRENCCWVVYNVLLAGGAPPASVWSPWRPGMIRRYMVNFVGDGSPLFRLIGNFLPF